MRQIVLLDGKGQKWRVPVGEGLVTVRGLGRVNTDGLDRLVGRRLEVDGKDVVVLEASIRDLVETIRRRAQIVGLKDGPFLAFNCSLQAGNTVVEGGAGSGALTLMLAHAVAPSGRVVSYEVRRDFLEVARENVQRAGYEDLVEFRETDVSEGIEETDAKAVVLDLPEPWKALPSARKALRASGHFASYSPTVEQMRETVLALRAQWFADIWSVELLERRMEVGRGTRPTFQMLGHTGYMTFARRLERAS